ncbi:MAG TPA: HAD family hydrolase [Flavobacteriales bacterium]|nr:HAD family hydrolase [Flavobacteriales bacterium]
MNNISYKEKLKHITTIILDFDGVLTDGTVFLLPPKEFVRTMHVRDSFAIEYAVKNGLNIAVITGGNNEVVVERMKYLGVNDVFLRASKNKLEIYEHYKKDKNLKNEEILYMGDDIPDCEPLKVAGLAACPNDAADEIKKLCEYISPYNGGQGCVRDVITQILKLKGKWPF